MPEGKRVDLNPPHKESNHEVQQKPKKKKKKKWVSVLFFKEVPNVTTEASMLFSAYLVLSILFWLSYAYTNGMVDWITFWNGVSSAFKENPKIFVTFLAMVCFGTVAVMLSISIINSILVDVYSNKKDLIMGSKSVILVTIGVITVYGAFNPIDAFGITLNDSILLLSGIAFATFLAGFFLMFGVYRIIKGEQWQIYVRLGLLTALIILSATNRVGIGLVLINFIAGALVAGAVEDGIQYGIKKKESEHKDKLKKHNDQLEIKP